MNKNQIKAALAVIGLLALALLGEVFKPLLLVYFVIFVGIGLYLMLYKLIEGNKK